MGLRRFNTYSARLVALKHGSSHATAMDASGNLIIALTCLCAAGKVMVLEALLKSIRSSAPTDKVVLVSNYTGGPAPNLLNP